MRMSIMELMWNTTNSRINKLNQKYQRSNALNIKKWNEAIHDYSNTNSTTNSLLKSLTKKDDKIKI